MKRYNNEKMATSHQPETRAAFFIKSNKTMDSNKAQNKRPHKG
jgi:hypothetical protein